MDSQDNCILPKVNISTDSQIQSAMSIEKIFEKKPLVVSPVHNADYQYFNKHMHSTPASKNGRLLRTEVSFRNVP